MNQPVPLELIEVNHRDYELIFPDKDQLTINTLNDGLITAQTK